MRQPNNSFLLSFGEQVRSYRKLLQISQEELSERSGLDRTYISGLERGVRNPTILIVERIGLALGVSPHKLLIPVNSDVPEESERE